MQNMRVNQQNIQGNDDELAKCFLPISQKMNNNQHAEDIKLIQNEMKTIATTIFKRVMKYSTKEERLTGMPIICASPLEYQQQFQVRNELIKENQEVVQEIKLDRMFQKGDPPVTFDSLKFYKQKFNVNIE
ncbi:Hypothetical_protein [Hexamita inflata]|uniref:Hypothetical_protein n=1 Tax=Hexamita inflata TaxID=28002 RepID=A0AA86P4S9_9EUKA|nr:Hypothetical protein HINF_LOCUS19624 [Hexamita inflata]CAI9965592.1 Hypothetical protein HINF_LOCUS53237 [Hexamita inflata]CAI9969358.1 Hypothetical protein HINF_LOCUS57003 [Hexamita inflata]